jgi:hypothetical protein
MYNLKSEDRNAFLNQETTSMKLPAGTLLYRFSGIDVIPEKKKTSDTELKFITPWWSEAKGLYDFLEQAKSSNIPFQNYLRKRSAVKRSWNSLSCLIIAKLNVEKHVYSGTIAPQNEASSYSDKSSGEYKKKYTKSVFFGGGGKQVFIPNLLEKEIEIKLPHETVYISDKIDEIIGFLESCNF